MKKKKQSTVCGIIVVIFVLFFYHYWKIICSILVIALLGYILWRIYKAKKGKMQKNSDTPSPSSNVENALPTQIEIQKKNILQQKEITKSIQNDLEIEFVEISTSGDENVCPMCAQFEGKIFPAGHAPKLPLCPNCSCEYMYHFNKNELCSDAVISNVNDFILPSEHTPMFYDTQHKAYDETDIMKRICICERQLKELSKFMEPYISAKFPAPIELACRDLLPDLYMQLGNWEKAERTIKACIDAGAYYPEDGSVELTYMNSYQKVATETLSFLSQNPGYLQRNIYKAMEYEGLEKEILKDFLRSSRLIHKEKYNNTNKLFCSIM